MILSRLVDKLKTNLRSCIILTVIILLGLFGFKDCARMQKRQDKQASGTSLAPNQQEKIVVNPEKHTIEIVTKKNNGTTTVTNTYLPDRPTQITENNNGKLTIIDHKFGVETRPYIGVGGSLDGTARIHTGVDLWYFHKVDLGAGLDLNAGIFNEVSKLGDTRASVNMSYNFYSNTSLALSVDNRKFVGLFLKVRL